MKDNLGWVRRVALALGPLWAIFTVAVSSPFEALSPEAWRVVGLAGWMALWWFTECVPIPTTALVPMLWLPLTGVTDGKTATAHYADPIIFLFLGGFIIAQGVQTSGLHHRVAFWIIRRMGRTPHGLIGGFMLATAFISMWVNNTSTTMLMYAVSLPIVARLREVVGREQVGRISSALMLGIAYSASIGGVGTLIGTAPNAFLAGFLQENYRYTITIASWFWIGIPFVGLMLPFTWFWLTRGVRGKQDAFQLVHTSLVNETSTKTAWSVAEFGMLGVFAFVVAGWLGRALFAEWTGLPITDSMIAMMGALLLFVLPSGQGRAILAWREAERIPWGVLILFGGGLALASAFESTGLAKAIGESVKALGTVNVWGLVLGVATLIIFLTELTSNTATTATFLPIVSATAVGLGLDPRFLAIPVAVGASAAFMLPVATPPNAIVFASGEVTMTQMIRAGFVLNLYCILITTLITLTVARWGLGF